MKRMRVQIDFEYELPEQSLEVLKTLSEDELSNELQGLKNIFKNKFPELPQETQEAIEVYLELRE